MTQDPVTLKILVIGESAVGKSCLLVRYTDNRFEESFVTTIGVDFKTKLLSIDNQSVKMQIWDTAGQEQFKSITKAYFRGAHGILVVFDLTRRDTFILSQSWIESIREGSSDPIEIILVGNKCDLPRAVSEDEAKKLAQQFNIPYFETSAKNNINVERVFVQIATAALRHKLSSSASKQTNTRDLAEDKKDTDEKGCSC